MCTPTNHKQALSQHPSCLDSHHSPAIWSNATFAEDKLWFLLFRAGWGPILWKVLMLPAYWQAITFISDNWVSLGKGLNSTIKGKMKSQVLDNIWDGTDSRDISVSRRSTAKHIGTKQRVKTQWTPGRIFTCGMKSTEKACSFWGCYLGKVWFGGRSSDSWKPWNAISRSHP